MLDDIRRLNQEITKGIRGGKSEETQIALAAIAEPDSVRQQFRDWRKAMNTCRALMRMLLNPHSWQDIRTMAARLQRDLQQMDRHYR